MWRLAVLALCVGSPAVAAPEPGSAAPGADPTATPASSAAPNATGAAPPAPAAPISPPPPASAGPPGPPIAAAVAVDDTWRYRASGDVALDAGLALAFPSALPTGMATGVAAGVSVGHRLAWGARAAWVTTTESSVPWTVTQSDLRLRATLAAQATAGRGTLGLRLGLGGTLVHETRVRNQGMRAGLTGSELETSALVMLPAADLDAVVALHIAGPWLVVTSAGPSIDRRDGALHAGWSAELGVAWQP